MWNNIIHKYERKLARWKQRYISCGGRVTLIKAALTSIPIYFLSFFRIPKSVEERLKRIQRRFLWGGGLEQKRIAWIKWDQVCMPKEKGGLGIKDIRIFNLALLGKWKWNYMQEKGEIWSRVLDSKYGGWRSLYEEGRIGHQSLWWKDLKQTVNSNVHQSTTLYN